MLKNMFVVMCSSPFMLFQQFNNICVIKVAYFRLSAAVIALRSWEGAGLKLVFEASVSISSANMMPLCCHMQFSQQTQFTTCTCYQSPFTLVFIKNPADKCIYYGCAHNIDTRIYRELFEGMRAAVSILRFSIDVAL